LRFNKIIIGAMTVQLYLHGVNSLKAKRSIVKSVIERLQSRFNASVSEVDHQDIYNSAIIGIALVTNETQFAHRQMDKMIDFMRGDGRFSLGEIERETF